ncbi:MAG: hypothetical protein AB4050_02200 [Synechococcus sp.]
MTSLSGIIAFFGPFPSIEQWNSAIAIPETIATRIMLVLQRPYHCRHFSDVHPLVLLEIVVLTQMASQLT